MRELHTLTDLQITLLNEIWRNGEATVRDVYEAQAQELGLALKTVGTVLRRLEAQGVLEHREEERQFVYRAVASRDDVRHATVAAMADNLFAGSAGDLVAHVLRNGHVDRADRAAIRRLLAEDGPDG